MAENVNLVDTVLDVADGSAVTAKTYIYIGQEEMYVESVTGNKITVKRAQDNTTPQNHVLGAAVNSITSADNDLIEFGDDFGFNGSVF